MCEEKHWESYFLAIVNTHTHTDRSTNAHKSIPLPTIINPRALRSASLYYKLPTSSLQQSGNIKLEPHSAINPTSSYPPPIPLTHTHTPFHSARRPSNTECGASAGPKAPFWHTQTHLCKRSRCLFQWVRSGGLKSFKTCGNLIFI